jgi:tetratricopeptide (TPR) repeat protein
VRTGEEGPTLDQAVWGYDSAAVYGLVDGLRTASEILEDYYLATFETASILAELVRENLIRMATDTELADAGNGFFEQSEWRRAIQFLERARPLRPEDARLIERLAVCHEAVGARREAAEALVALASLRAVRMETADAINILERAAGLDPASPAAPQLLMGLYRDVGDGARAAACAARAGEIYLSQGRADVAEDTWNSHRTTSPCAPFWPTPASHSATCRPPSSISRRSPPPPKPGATCRSSARWPARSSSSIPAAARWPRVSRSSPRTAGASDGV